VSTHFVIPGRRSLSLFRGAALFRHSGAPKANPESRTKSALTWSARLQSAQKVLMGAAMIVSDRSKVDDPV
jgi:hypothetical protein